MTSWVVDADETFGKVKFEKGVENSQNFAKNLVIALRSKQNLWNLTFVGLEIWAKVTTFKRMLFLQLHRDHTHITIYIGPRNKTIAVDIDFCQFDFCTCF